MFQIRNIERYTNTRIHRARIPTEAEVEAALENVFLDKLRATLRGGGFRNHEHLVERLLEEGFSSTDIASACLAQMQGIEDGPPRPPQQEAPSKRPAPARQPAPPRREPPARSDAPVRPPTPRRETAPPPPAAAKPKLQPTAPKPKPPMPADLPPRVNTQPESPRPTAVEPAVKPPLPPTATEEFTRLHINLGESHGVQPGDIVNAIAGETGLPPKVVGKVDIRERHLFVDVAAPHANAILSKLKRTQIRGKRVKIKAA